MSKQPHEADAMLNAVADYLKSNGWNVVVIGSPRVQKPIGEREFNYEFVVRFTGSQPKEKTGGLNDAAKTT